MGEMMTWEYLAGFFDGEGSIQIAKQNRKGRYTPWYRVRITIGQKRRYILDKIKKFIKRGYVYASREDLYCFYLYDGLAVNVIKKMLPYLKVKKIQAKLAVQFHENRLRRYAKYRLPKNEVKWRNMHKQLIMYINRQGGITL